MIGEINRGNLLYITANKYYIPKDSLSGSIMYKTSQVLSYAHKCAQKTGENEMQRVLLWYLRVIDRGDFFCLLSYIF